MGSRYINNNNGCISMGNWELEKCGSIHILKLQNRSFNLTFELWTHYLEFLTLTDNCADNLTDATVSLTCLVGEVTQ